MKLPAGYEWYVTPIGHKMSVGIYCKGGFVPLYSTTVYPHKVEKAVQELFRKFTRGYELEDESARAAKKLREELNG